MNALFSWIGSKDINSYKDEDKGSPLKTIFNNTEFIKKYDKIYLFYTNEHSSYNDNTEWINKINKYKKYLNNNYSYKIEFKLFHISVVNMREIKDKLTKFIEKLSDIKNYTFATSSGTPQMAAIWYILSIKYNAKLVHTFNNEINPLEFPFIMKEQIIENITNETNKDYLESEEYKVIKSKSKIMEKIKEEANLYGKNNAYTLILGENGTGKELIAKAIHKSSDRKGEYLSINCGAIPENLIESILFGYVKGAFTGANKDKKGYFEKANKGTLFLDEIGDLSLYNQVKLLRVIEYGEFTPIGSSETKKTDVLIITATNKNLKEMIKNKEFREDLYYRINIGEIYLPPLRERKEDIELLLNHYLDEIYNEKKKLLDPNAKKNNEKKLLDQNAKEFLINYEWPGNIRQLINILKRAYITTNSNIIKKEDIEKYLNNSEEKVIDIMKQKSLPDFLNYIENEIIKKILKNENNNIKKTSEILGIKEKTLYSKLKSLKEK
jgi:transcriptional regulator with PAS, ATPase and Fis domain